MSLYAKLTSFVILKIYFSGSLFWFMYCFLSFSAISSNSRLPRIYLRTCIAFFSLIFFSMSDDLSSFNYYLSDMVFSKSSCSKSNLVDFRASSCSMCSMTFRLTVNITSGSLSPLMTYIQGSLRHENSLRLPTTWRSRVCKCMSPSKPHSSSIFSPSVTPSDSSILT